jgi:hypothetical protein
MKVDASVTDPVASEMLARVLQPSKSEDLNKAYSTSVTGLEKRGSADGWPATWKITR